MPPSTLSLRPELLDDVSAPITRQHRVWVVGMLATTLAEEPDCWWAEEASHGRPDKFEI